MGPNLQFPTHLATFNEEILDGKLNFLCIGEYHKYQFNLPLMWLPQQYFD